MKRTAWIFGLIVAATLTVVFGYPLLRPKVIVTRAVEAPIVQAFYATGTVSSARQESDLHSSVAGIVTLSPGIDKGSHVSAGQVVAVVTDPQRRLGLDKASAERDAARKMADPNNSPALLELRDKRAAVLDQLKLAQDDEGRLNELYKHNAASHSDWDKSVDRETGLRSDASALEHEAAAKLIELQEQLTIADAAVTCAQAVLDQEQVRSPVDGMVLDRPVATGTRIAENGHVMQVADVRPETLVMRAQVDEEDRNLLIEPKDGMPYDQLQKVEMTLYAFPHHAPFAGRVVKVYPKADPERRTYEVDVRLDDASISLAMGMTGELAFITDEKKSALVVPRQAVQHGMLWVVRDGQLMALKADVGLENVERAEIRSGLQAGDMIVISSDHDLSGGKRVRTQFMDPAEAAGLNKPREADAASHFTGF